MNPQYPGMTVYFMHRTPGVLPWDVHIGNPSVGVLFGRIFLLETAKMKIEGNNGMSE